MNRSAVLDAFFQSPNRLSRDDVQVPPAITQAADAFLEDGEPVILPRKTERETVWYGIATSEKSAKRLSEEVRAFIGPSYSTYDGGRAQLDVSDPLEEALQSLTDGHVLRFTGNDEAIVAALDRMLEVRRQQTPFEKEEDLGVGLLLRRFEMALRAGDREAAEAQVQRLRERELLEPSNVTALTVRMLVAFGAWEEVLDHEDLPRLLQQRERSLAVTQALMRAVYRVHLEPKEDDPEAALEKFETEVRPEFGPLFAVRASMRAPEVLKAFMLKAVAGEERDEALRDELLEVAAAEGLDDEMLCAFAALGQESEAEADKPASDEELVREARNSIFSGRLDHAFRCIQKAGPSEQKARVLGVLYPKMSSIKLEEEIVSTLQELPDAVRDELVATDETLQSIYESGGEPSNWVEWFQRVEEAEYTSTRALERTEKLADQWSPGRVLSSSGALTELVAAVETAPSSDQAGQTVNRALPYLLRAFQQDPEYPRPSFHDLYRAVHAHIPYSDDLTENDLEVYLDLSEMLLGRGVSKNVYGEVVTEEVPYIWEKMHSPHHVDWLLDVAEVLRLTPARDESALLNFLSQVVQAVNQYREHIQPIQLDLLSSLCDEVGHPEMMPDINMSDDGEEEEHDPVQVLLDDKTLGIYTLTESAGRRVKSFLDERYPTAKINLSHDKHGGSRLHQIAQAADYFLVVSRSASHAATGIIEQHIPTERLIYPQGKGSSSMIRDLAEYARKQTE